MARYYFHISVIPHDNFATDAVLTKKVCQDFPFTRTCKKPFLNWLKENFQFFNWKFDDGNDEPNTDYCQYVADIPEDGYLLAVLQEISETLYNELT